jgi:hypothetical protein
VEVTSSAGFAAGSTLSLNSNANCAGTLLDSETIAAADVTKPVTLSIPTAQVNSAFGTAGDNPVYVCYTNTVTTNQIPASSFSAVGTIVKAPDTGSNHFSEQNNVCGDGLYALGGGIKIDVRNYANSKVEGWQSVIRIINTSETGTATVYGQIIEKNGKFGPWGEIARLGPRAVINLPADVIDGMLTTPANPTNASDKGSDAVEPYDSTGAPRLRITAEGTNSLRVQNYMMQPDGTVFEFSSAQGVDFNTDTTRAPGGEGQYHSQDARTGLDGKN